MYCTSWLASHLWSFCLSLPGCWDWRGTKRLLALMSYFTLLFELTSTGCWVPCNTPWLAGQHSQCVIATCGRGLAFWVAQCSISAIHLTYISPPHPPVALWEPHWWPVLQTTNPRGPQPLRHAPGSVTGVCVTASWFCFLHWALSRHLSIHLAVLVLITPEELPPPAHRKEMLRTYREVVLRQASHGGTLQDCSLSDARKHCRVFCLFETAMATFQMSSKTSKVQQDNEKDKKELI